MLDVEWDIDSGGLTFYIYDPVDFKNGFIPIAQLISVVPIMEEEKHSLLSELKNMEKQDEDITSGTNLCGDYPFVSEKELNEMININDNSNNKQEIAAKHLKGELIYGLAELSGKMERLINQINGMTKKIENG